MAQTHRDDTTRYREIFSFRLNRYETTYINQMKIPIPTSMGFESAKYNVSSNFLNRH